MQPGSNPHTLNDLVPRVREALQNRQDVTAVQICGWLQSSILNITDNYPFEELRTTGPIVKLPANPTPPLSVPVASYINTNDDYTLMEDPVIFLDPPTNTIGYPMDYMTMKAIQPLLFVPGAIPFKYTRWGSNFLFGGLPNLSYPTYLPYQLRYPFVDNNLPGTKCLFPTSWEEVFSYDAARRGCILLRWPDQAKMLQELLYGDPKNQEGNPGLIKELVSQQNKDSRNSSRQLTVRIGRY